jgi:hypothetical protein
MNLLDDTLKPDLKIKGYTFIFGQVNLVIAKSNWFGINEIKKLSYESIDDLKLIIPTRDNFFLLKLLFSLIVSFIGAPVISFRRHVLMKYHVEEDKAVYRLDININESQFKELKNTLQNLKKPLS